MLSYVEEKRIADEAAAIKEATLTGHWKVPVIKGLSGSFCQSLKFPPLVLAIATLLVDFMPKIFVQGTLVKARLSIEKSTISPSWHLNAPLSSVTCSRQLLY
jgi:hypothetical protein